MSERVLDAAEMYPPTEARVSLRAMFILTAVAAVGAAVFGAVLRPLEASKQGKLVAFAAFSVLVLLAIAVGLGWLRRRAENKAGKVLVQLSPHSYFLPRAPRVMAFVMGAMLFAAGSLVWLFGAIAIAADDFTPGIQATFPAYITFLPQFLILAGQANLLTALGIACIWWNGCVRFCEHGIVRRQEFVPWDNVSRHYWDACYPHVLVVYWGVRVLSTSAIDPATGKKRRLKLREYPPSGQVALRVLAEQREVVTALLNAKLPRASATT